MLQAYMYFLSLLLQLLTTRSIPAWSTTADREVAAWFWCRLTFAWLFPLLNRGHKHTLEVRYPVWLLAGLLIFIIPHIDNIIEILKIHLF